MADQEEAKLVKPSRKQDLATARMGEYIARPYGNPDPKSIDPREVDRRTRYAKAVEALAGDQVDKAEALLLSLRKELPRNTDVERLLALAAMQRGDTGGAERRIRRAIKWQPGRALLQVTHAHLHHSSGRLKPAKHCLEAAIRLDPGLAEAHGNLGNVLAALEDFDGAAAAYECALELKASDGVLYANYLRTLVRIGDVATALKLIERAKDERLDTRYLFELAGTKLLEADRLAEAVQVFAEGLQIHPEAPGLAVGLGHALIQRQAAPEAVLLMREVYEHHPDNPAVLEVYAAALVTTGQYTTGRDILTRRLQIGPRKAAPLANLAVVVKQIGDLETAESYAREALELDADQAAARGILVDILNARGEFKEALAHLQAGVDSPNSRSSMFYQLFRAKKNVNEATDVAALLSDMKDRQNISSDDFIAYNFALGEAFHKLKSSDRAAFHYKAANGVKNFQYRALGMGYNRDAFDARVTALENFFTPGLFERLQGLGNPSKRPVFIVGMPRSGTTLTEQIIASHPQVHGAGELKAMSNAVTNVVTWLGENNPELTYPACVSAWGAEGFDRLAQEYLCDIAELNSSASRVTDKLPHNFLYLGVIALAFPNATLIHCKRDPIDTCLSCWQQNFLGPHTYTTDLQDLGHHYRAYERLMTHWRSLLGGRLYEIQYEELVASQEAKSRELIAHCRLDWDDRCLAFNAQKREVKTASLFQVRQGIYTSSISKWRPYAPYLGELFEALGLDPEEMQKIAAET